MSKAYNDIRDAVEANAEVLIDKFAGVFLRSDTAQIIGDFPMISTAKGVVTGLYSIANWRIARNITYFLHGLQKCNASEDEYDKLLEKYGRERILENALLSLEAMRSEKQALAFSFLFDALVKGDLEWGRYSELQNILEKIDPAALDEDFNKNQPTHRLTVVGLAYLQTVIGGVKVLPNGQLYNEFEKYIVIPYRDSSEKE